MKKLMFPLVVFLTCSHPSIHADWIGWYKTKSDPTESQKDRQEVLFAAAERGDTELVRKLIAQGVDVEAPLTGKVMTPLAVAAKNGHRIIVELLLDNGANIDAEYSESPGLTPLMLAALEGKEEVLRFLIDRGANKEVRTVWGETPLLMVARFTAEPGIAAILAGKGANIEARGDEGMTPLLWAAKQSTAPVLAALLVGRADLNARDPEGNTALHLAAAGQTVDSSDKLRMLLDPAFQRGVENIVNVRNKKGETALMIAERVGNKPALEYLKNILGSVNKNLSDPY